MGAEVTVGGIIRLDNRSTIGKDWEMVIQPQASQILLLTYPTSWSEISVNPT